jgi:hypothetical protein
VKVWVESIVHWEDCQSFVSVGGRFVHGHGHLGGRHRNRARRLEVHEHAWETPERGPPRAPSPRGSCFSGGPAQSTRSARHVPGCRSATSARRSPTKGLAAARRTDGDSRVLHDALEILILMAAENDPRFDRAAARWVGRLVAETPIALADGRYAIALVERLPQCLRRCGASHVGASNDQRRRRGGRAALIIAGLSRDLSPARRCAERGAAAFVENVLGAASKPVRRRCAVRRRAGGAS